MRDITNGGANRIYRIGLIGSDKYYLIKSPKRD